MNEKEKESLKQMIAENNVEDQTEKIRNTKHSELIKQDVITMQQLKQNINALKIVKFSTVCVFHAVSFYLITTRIYLIV